MTEDRQASSIEMVPLHVAAERYDVAILGGGLAGLTLAIQLKRTRPKTSVAVLEKREGPAPLAAFKVGESTVPAGAEYFANIVGVEDHLREKHNVKFGLRFWMPAGNNSDITQRIEFGPGYYPAHDNFQIDRGLFENELAARARSLGVEVLQGARVAGVDFGPDEHTVRFTQSDAEAAVRARWVVDAAGRASLLKRQLGLSQEISHTINSSWLRLKGGLDLEQWGADNEQFMAKTPQPGLRQFSTNHLLGTGYWVWLIPLSTGPISIGVCADPRFHPFEEIAELDRLLEWFSRHEPQLSASLDGRRDDIEDFLRVEDFAYGVEKTYSTDRWSLVGEAGAFADPFYSPGSDFIGYGNCMTTDLVTSDLDGEDIAERVEFYNGFYQSAFAHVIQKYTDHYETWGEPAVMGTKLIWDGFVNHSVETLLMTQYKIGDYEFMRSVDDDVQAIRRLNINVQQLMRDWRDIREGEAPPQPGVGLMPFIRATAGVAKEFGDEELREELRWAREAGEANSVALFHHAAGLVLSEKPDPSRPVNPYAVSLHPERWEADGLYDDSGLTLERATELTSFPAGMGGPPGGGPPGAGRPAGMGPPPGFGPPGMGGPPPGFGPPGFGGPPGVGNGKRPGLGSLPAPIAKLIKRVVAVGAFVGFLLGFGVAALLLELL